MVRQVLDTLTTREIQDREYEKEAWDKQAAHQLRLKDKEIEVMKLEAKWSAWIKLPLLLITLPVRLLLVIPLSIYAAKGKEVPAEYWKLLS